MNRVLRTVMGFGVLIILLGVPPTVSSQVDKEYWFLPKEGVIPDEGTAVRVGMAVLSPVYGEAKIKSEMPFKAKLSKGVWAIEGTLPNGMVGGVASIRIKKLDGRVLGMSHGK
jgi:hypothetical protein